MRLVTLATVSVLFVALTLSSTIGINTSEAQAKRGSADPRARLERQKRYVSNRYEVVGPNQTVVGVRLPSPWEARTPQPGDSDFAAAQNAAWQTLERAVDKYIEDFNPYAPPIRRRKPTMEPNSVTALDSVPNVFVIYDFAASELPSLRRDPHILFASNNAGGVMVLPQNPEKNDLIHPAQIALENLGGIEYVDIDEKRHSSVRDIDIDILNAWEVTVGRPDVVVAVIDEAVDLTKPELAVNVYTNTREVPCNGKDDDGNGFKDDYQGYNASYQTGCVPISRSRCPSRGPCEPEVPLLSHGTAMALTIASPPRSSPGAITGVAPGVRYLPISYTNVNSRDLAFAYVLAMKRAGVPIRVVNFSGGLQDAPPYACYLLKGGKGPTLSPLGELLASDITVVAAAGNSGSDNDKSFVCPGNLSRDYENVITVAAIDPEGRLPFFSNFGRTSVSTAAPGVAIYNGYGYQTGTSPAAALVSGVAALMYSANPRLTPANVKKIVLETAKFTERNLPVVSNGFVSAGHAVQRAKQLATPRPGIKKPSLRY